MRLQWPQALAISSLLYVPYTVTGSASHSAYCGAGREVCGLYLASGYLLMPIVAHILIDLIQGITFSLYLRAVPQQS